MTAIVRPVIDLLEASRPTTKAKSVDGVLALGAALDALKVSPSQFVVRTGGSARPSSGNAYQLVQDSEITFDVVTGTLLPALHNATDDLDAIIDATKAVLVGWQHPAAEGLTEFRSEGVAQLVWAKGQHFWRQSFAFNTTLRSP